MSQIIPEIEKTAKLVQEISAASMEQNSGADQINSAIQQLNNVTQQSAEGIQQIAHSAEDLSKLTNTLQELVSQFKISNEQKKEKSKSDIYGKYVIRENGKLINS